MNFSDLIITLADYNYTKHCSDNPKAPAWKDLKNDALKLLFISEATTVVKDYEEVFKDHERFKRQFESCVTPTDEAGEYTERVYQNIQKLSDLHEENSTEVTIDEYRKAYDDAVQE